MPFCQNCGAPVDGRFCAKCGAPVGQPPAESSTVPPAGPSSTSLSDNIAGALAYVPVIGVIFLLIEPYGSNKAVRFHALQGLFLLAVAIAVNIVMSMVVSVVWGMVFLMPLIHLIFVGFWLYLMFQTYQGRKIVLPVIGPIAEKQA